MRAMRLNLSEYGHKPAHVGFGGSDILFRLRARYVMGRVFGDQLDPSETHASFHADGSICGSARYDASVGR